MITLLVTLAIPSITATLVDPPDSSMIDYSQRPFGAPVAARLPWQQTPETWVMERLARSLDRWLVRSLERARAAAYERRLRPEVSPRADWDAMAMCESSQRWHLNVGPFDGGLQFLPSTWDVYGGREFAPSAWQATRLEQIVVASRVLRVQGPSAWPNCFRWA